MKYLIAISLLISHTAAAAQLTGRYVTNEELMIGGQDEIVFNSNGTGTYMPGSCLGPIVSETRYSLSADTVFLFLVLNDSVGRQLTVRALDTLIYKKRHLTSLSGWKYYKQKPRRE